MKSKECLKEFKSLNNNQINEKVEELRNKDASFDEDVQLLIRMLES